VIDYQSQRRASLDKIATQRVQARKTLLEKLDPILNTYIKENSISLVVDKKNILMGNTDLDITKVITERLNKEFPSLSIE
jgi:Skp family chaperone for outer membrane proteins